MLALARGRYLRVSEEAGGEKGREGSSVVIVGEERDVSNVDEGACQAVMNAGDSL